MWKVLFASILIVTIFFGIGETRTKIEKNPTSQPEVIDVDKKPTPSILKHKHKASCETTTAEPVQIICILDRSGSMSSLAEDTIGGYNSFLAKQKEKPGTAEVTTVLFDNEYEIISDGVDLREVPDLTAATYYARGTTALLDAVGMTLNNVLGKMEKDGVCPEKRSVLVMIMTDGLENASTEYNKATVKSLIEATTENYHWNYIFMGANIDSAQEASAIGINKKHAMNYSADKKGVENSFARMSEAADEVREKGTLR